MYKLSLGKYFHTISHLYLDQISGRILYNIKRRSGLLQPLKSPHILKYNLNYKLPFISHIPWNNNNNDIKNGIFKFINKSFNIGMPVSWDNAQISLLWKYNLYYFQYLFLLTPELQLELCRQWMRYHTVFTGIGYNPYPLSLRIVNWIKAGIAEPDILRSLYKQASYLYRSIEYFYSGNHLLENARALIFAGICFEGQGEATKWKNTGLSIFLEELPKQILPDGSFYERSPMYHALMLEAVLDVINILDEDHPDKLFLEKIAQKMSDFLISATHPTGKIALFNDATEEVAPPVHKLLSYIEKLVSYSPRRKREFADSGYFIIENEPVYCVIDGGPAGPDHLLAHAHADIFSYELSLFGKKCIVDTGVYEYEAGKMRQHVRSTRAHNTVCIDNTDQIECWNSFRVARRYNPYNVSFSCNNDTIEFNGEYEGYAKLIGDGIVHQRKILYSRKERKIEVHDSIRGRGLHLVESSIHYHPDVKIVSERGEIQIDHSGKIITINTNTGYKIDSGWYCPEFGIKIPNKVIRIGGDMNLPAELVYTIYY